ncbi:MAG: large-conductance mechanosensitive channel protein MscL [Phenylobacterium sp.]|uniref:large-conductance mechanosensitive channel protein MscL n=1 Tax=Phenylobacterium sp. TaxID=1871053 RepID=UPI0008AC243A|nr:large-conductance mechanosensitive channel protein MscL [Phenylobacterium sp.]MBA4793629.1 large-conductance mechanosensitive channel protein MscL [Phenylobacterium sp.]OHB33667.1 MAG: mechanosensitive ion channel protein MscL [Phenylobacterium sp. RIFCSPHIGHO2_01_FULL_70_10]
MSIVSEFREFIERGNVIDLAVGVIIGASFNAIVKSLVDQVVMPPIGLLTGGIDFSRLKWVLRPEDPATEAVEQVAIQYGAFINTVIQFLIVAWVVFLLVKLVNSVRRREAEKPPEAKPQPTATEVLLMEIRDQLKAQNAAAGATPAPPGAGSTAPKA